MLKILGKFQFRFKQNTCPEGAINYDSDLESYWIDYNCTNCGECIDICPVNAIYNDGQSSPEYDSPFNEDTFFNSSIDTWTDVPYEWGGNDTTGIDCSHLVWQIYNENDLSYDYCTTHNFSSSPYFYEVSNPITGDVILYPGHHMVIYVENPRQMVIIYIAQLVQEECDMEQLIGLQVRLYILDIKIRNLLR